MQFPYPSHTRQFRTYISITNAPFGKVLYIFLGSNAAIFFKEYLVVVTAGEREAILEKLEQGARRMEMVSGIAFAPIH